MRDDHLIRPPQLPIAAARQVVRSLLNMGVAEEVSAPIEDADFVWRRDGGSALMLRATDLGLARIRDCEADNAVPVADTTEPAVMVSADAHRAGAPELWPVGDVPDGELQPGWDVTQSPPQLEGATAACKSFEAVQETPTVSVRPPRQSQLRQAAQALLVAWDEAASADILDEHFAALRAALMTRERNTSVDPSAARHQAGARC